MEKAMDDERDRGMCAVIACAMTWVAITAAAEGAGTSRSVVRGAGELRGHLSGTGGGDQPERIFTPVTASPVTPTQGL